MSKFRLGLVLILLAVALAGFALAAPAPTRAAGPVTVTLDALNNSGESGTATLTDAGSGQTKVDVVVTGEPSGADQPVHIHKGQCGPTLGAVAFPLTNVKDGKSTTTVNIGLAALQNGDYAINGHKSAAEIATYVFCGNIPAAAAAQTTTTATVAATATTMPTVAATTAPTTAATAAATSTTTSGAPSTAPTTGADPYSFIMLALAVGLLALGMGLVLSRRTR